MTANNVDLTPGLWVLRDSDLGSTTSTSIYMLGPEGGLRTQSAGPPYFPKFGPHYDLDGSIHFDYLPR